MRPATINAKTAAQLHQASAPGWNHDPFGEHKLRYRDAHGWTDHCTHFGPVPCAGCGEASF